METLKHKLTHTELLALYAIFEDLELPHPTNIAITVAALQLQVLKKIKTKMVESKSHYKLQLTIAEVGAMNSLLGVYELCDNLWLNVFIAKLYAANDKFLSNYRTAPLRKQIEG